MDSHREQLRAMIEGYRQTALIGVVCQTGLCDIIATGCNSIQQISHEHKWSLSVIERIIRGIVLLGLVEPVCSENVNENTVLKLTEMGELLTTASMRGERFYSMLSLDQYVASWSAISSALTGDITPFQSAFGLSVWEYRRANATSGSLFNTWLAKQLAHYSEPIVAALDMTDVKSVVDIGGGTGSLLRALLSRNPCLFGILADQPTVVNSIDTSQGWDKFADRFKAIPVDFFGSVPSDCDSYLLKSILHDWQDEDCVRILAVIKKAMHPNAKLYVIERIMPDDPRSDPTTVWLDLHMLCVTGGRERTVREYRDLLRAAGLDLTQVLKTESPFRLLEACPSRS